jgi:hypothetical protein
MIVGSVHNQYQNAGMYGRTSAKAGTAKSCAFASTTNSLRRFESEERSNEKRSQSVVDQSMAYAQKLSASRANTKKASLEKKKLQYSFKKISSQIVRSKTSVSARKAVQAAKREINRLKRLKGSGEYDEEELQLAIDHAKAMEKVAKKKVSHLEQEEMIERNGHGLSGELDEIEEKKDGSDQEENEELNEEVPEDAALEAGAYEIQDGMEDYEYEMALQMQEMQEEMSQQQQISAEEFANSTDDMMDQLMDAMDEMIEDMDLTELAQSTFAPDPNMSEDDLKMLKIKHRYKELKEITEADKEYLKGIMEHEKSKAASGISGAMGSSSPSSASTVFKADAPAIHPAISMPGAAAGGVPAPTIGGGFDVSV